MFCEKTRSQVVTAPQRFLKASLKKKKMFAFIWVYHRVISGSHVYSSPSWKVAVSAHWSTYMLTHTLLQRSESSSWSTCVVKCICSMKNEAWNRKKSLIFFLMLLSWGQMKLQQGCVLSISLFSYGRLCVERELLPLNYFFHRIPRL